MTSTSWHYFVTFYRHRSSLCNQGKTTLYPCALLLHALYTSVQIMTVRTRNYCLDRWLLNPHSECGVLSVGGLCSVSVNWDATLHYSSLKKNNNPPTFQIMVLRDLIERFVNRVARSCLINWHALNFVGFVKKWNNFVPKLQSWAKVFGSLFFSYKLS